MSVRKREWTTRAGEQREAWIVDYSASGSRHIETFDRKKDADAFHDKVRNEVREGIHTARSKSITVLEAAENWLKHVEREGRERSTLDHYRQHVTLHLKPLHHYKLASLTTPRLNSFRDDLLGTVSRPLARKVLVSLKMLLREAQRRGDVAQNVGLGVSIKMDKRDKRKLKAGQDFPTPNEVKRLIDATTGRWRALLVTVVFTGLRASELRGLRWEDVDLKRGELHVRQRADRYNKIGSPKSHSGQRAVPLGPFVVNTLKEWKLACPKSELDLVFPNTVGKVQPLSNIAHRVWRPLQRQAGLVDVGGGPLFNFHALRHFAASWMIELGFSPKRLQALLGHSSVQMTFDRYGHLFPNAEDDHEKFSRGEVGLVA